MTEALAAPKGQASKGSTHRMKVMTGRHVGATIELNTARIRIGADTDASVCISDWNGPAVEVDLTIRRSGYRWRYGDKATDKSAEVRVWCPFQPLRFADIVLVLGPSSAPWPSDVDLLSRLSRSEDAEVQREPRIRRTVTAGLFLAGVAVLLAMAVSAKARDRAKDKAEPERQAIALESSLTTWGSEGLVVQRMDATLMLSGLLAGAESVRSLRTHLAKFPHVKVLHQYMAADDVSLALSESADAPLEVLYVGQRTFRISGPVRDPASTKSTLTKVVGDLGLKNVNLDFQLGRAENAPFRLAPAKLQGQRFLYEQLPNGTRHLMLLP